MSSTKTIALLQQRKGWLIRTRIPKIEGATKPHNRKAHRNGVRISIPLGICRTQPKAGDSGWEEALNQNVFFCTLQAPS